MAVLCAVADGWIYVGWSWLFGSASHWFFGDSSIFIVVEDEGEMPVFSSPFSGFHLGCYP